jgi:hypothetical protein
MADEFRWLQSTLFPQSGRAQDAPREGGEDELLDHLKPKPLARSWNKAYQHRKSSAISDPAFPTSHF